MRKRKTFLLLSLVLAILLLGIAYAAIDNVTLSIAGNVIASPDQASFDVKFNGNTEWSGAVEPELEVTGNTSAVMNVSGLTAMGDTVTGTFYIANNSADITAILSASATVDNTEYFTISTSLGANTLSPGEITYLSITVKLIKTPVSGNVTGWIDAQMTASPSYS